MSNGFSQSRASSLAKGFENPWQLGLLKHSPALLYSIRVYPSHLTRSFPFPRPSGQPSVALSRTCPRARLWLRIVSLRSVGVPKMIFLSMILPEKESRDERPGSRALTGYPVVTPEPHGAQEDNPLLPRALMILSTMISPEIFQSMSHLPPEREYLMIHQMARTPSFQLIFLPSA